MKKMLIAVAALLVLGIASFAATTTNVYTNVYNQVVTTETSDDGVITTTITKSTPGLAYRTQLGLGGIQLDTNASFVVSASASGYGAYKPRDIGDILIQTVSNFVFIATGVATSDWVQVSN